MRIVCMLCVYIYYRYIVFYINYKFSKISVKSYNTHIEEWAKSILSILANLCICIQKNTTKISEKVYFNRIIYTILYLYNGLQTKTIIIKKKKKHSNCLKENAPTFVNNFAFAKKKPQAYNSRQREFVWCDCAEPTEFTRSL